MTTNIKRKLLIKLKLEVTKVVFELNWFKRKLLAILKRQLFPLQQQLRTFLLHL
jgi:hypothetical protein